MANKKIDLAGLKEYDKGVKDALEKTLQNANRYTDSELADKANKEHTHTEYATKNEVRYELEAKADANHTHTELENKADISYVDDVAQNVAVLNDKVSNLTKEVICNHKDCITGKDDGGELAVEDQQMLIKKIQGQHFVLNQYVDYKNTMPTATSYGITYTNNNDGTLTVSGTSTAASYYNTQIIIDPSMSGHKVLLSMQSDLTNMIFYINTPYTNLIQGNTTPYKIVTLPKLTSNQPIRITIGSGKTINATLTPQLFDLTLMFGPGNEPTTAEIGDFFKMFPYYVDYNKGQLLISKNNLISYNEKQSQKDEMIIDTTLSSFDYIDNVANEKVVYISPVTTLNGSEDWMLGTTYTPTGGSSPTLQRFDLACDVSAIADLSDASARGTGVCNRMIWTYASGFKDLTPNNYICFGAGGVRIYVLMPYVSGITTVVAFKEWLSNNPVEFFYKLANPIIESTALPSGLAVWKGGSQHQTGELPYVLTKEYSLSLGGQVLANISIDKNQQKQIDKLINDSQNVVTKEELQNDLYKKADKTIIRSNLADTISPLFSLFNELGETDVMNLRDLEEEYLGSEILQMMYDEVEKICLWYDSNNMECDVMLLVDSYGDKNSDDGQFYSATNWSRSYVYVNTKYSINFYFTIFVGENQACEYFMRGPFCAYDTVEEYINQRDSKLTEDDVNNLIAEYMIRNYENGNNGSY